MYNEITCLFGHHDYSKRLTKDKGGNFVYLCKICQRSGHWKWDKEFEVWSDYDDRGNIVHEKWCSGFEYWCDYDEEGHCIHTKDSDGEEEWLSNAGNWTSTKPKNWIYEK